MNGQLIYDIIFVVVLISLASLFLKMGIKSKRVNIDYAEDDANLPWRFRMKNNKWTG